MLAFAPEPPCSACSPVLPACVSEGRGGETGFAMNQKTQLQFNLGVKPNQANLATKFDDTRPSPIVIEKMKPETIGLSRTPVGDFKAVSPERLALAMKLAKRNARLCSPRSGRSSPAYLESSDTSENGEKNVSGITRHTHLKPSPGPHKGPRQSHKGRTSPAVREAPVSSPVSSPVASITKEISKLKTDLRKQLAKLNKAKEGQDHLRTSQMPTVNDKVYWQEPVDEGEERVQQRREEQLARNARMTYDLSQQVAVPSLSCTESLFSHFVR